MEIVESSFLQAHRIDISLSRIAAAGYCKPAIVRDLAWKLLGEWEWFNWIGIKFGQRKYG